MTETTLPSPDLSTSLSRRMAGISVSATMASALRAAALARTGRDIISLALGELDFDTPSHVVDAAHAAALNGETRYTAPDGTAALKAAIAAKFERENRLTFGPPQIHVSAGAKQVIHNAMAATLEPDDEVVLVSPYWVSYADVVRLYGARPVMLRTTVETGFVPQAKDLAAVLGPKTKWLILNSPNNPTGAVYDRGALRSLADVLADWPKVLVLSDEIYEHLVFDGAEHISIGEVAPELGERLLVVNGVSKSYAMTGWRIGYSGGPQWLAEAMTKIQSQSTGNPSSVSQAAALAALCGDQSRIATWRAELQRRRDLGLAILRKSDRLSIPRSDGAFYLFAETSGCLGAKGPDGTILRTDADVADYLLETAGVALVQGAAFGASPYLRFSFALDSERFATACERVVAALEALVRPA